MLNLDATDVLEGIASTTNVVEFTFSGVDGTTIVSSEGKLTNSQTEIYTAAAATRLLSLTLVNTHSSAVTVNIQKDPTDAGTLYRVVPKDVSLGIGYSLHFDGQRCTVLDATGGILTTDIAHTIVSHSDTTATGAELETLTDDSMADAEHRHSELSGSDGTPNPALVVAATGRVGFNIAVPNYAVHVNVDSVGAVYVQLTNTDTGTGAGDGSLFGISDQEDFLIWNQEAHSILLATSGVQRVHVDLGGDVGVGSTVIPTANGGKVLFFGDNAAQPTMDTNTAGIYGFDPTTGTVGMYAVDEADNDTALTPHVFKLFQPDKAEPYPWSYYSRNKMIGKEINVDMTGAVRAIEELSGKKFIHYADIPKVPKDIVGGKRRAWKSRWIKENTIEIRVLKDEAVEQVEVEVATKEIAEYDTKWQLEDDGDLHYYKIPIYAKTTELKWQIKEGIRLDVENGYFYKTVIPSDKEAEIAANNGFSCKVPAWLAERMK